VTTPGVIRGSFLRGFAERPDGSFLLGGGSNSGPTALLAIDAALDIDGVVELSGAFVPDNIHGMCALPNGHIVAGAFGRDPASTVVELDEDGAYLRDVTGLTHQLSDCAASSSELYLVDYDGYTDTFGVVRRLELIDGRWVEQERVVITTFDGTSGSSAYSILLHTNGDLYIPPHRPEPGRQRHMVRCDNGDLSACRSDGAPLETGARLIQGIAQLPGRDDIVLATADALYLYSTDGLVQVADLSRSVPGIGLIRHLRAHRTRPRN
jgi:hypothetical protein